MTVNTAPNSCVKCALSSLGCSKALRAWIDDLAVKMQHIAFRGTHLANRVIVNALLESGNDGLLRDLPNVFDPKWWQHCFKAASDPRAAGKDEAISTLSRTLFADLSSIKGPAVTHSIETLSRDVTVNVRVMLILNFHKQLRKSFKRDVVYWLKAARHELDTSVFEATIDYCMFRCVQAGSRAPRRAFPSDASPAELQTYLDERIEAWRSLYGAALPCPVPEFVSNFKDEALRLLFRWFVDLQRHRRARMAEMTEHFRGDAEEARKCFRSAGKAMRTLPLAKLQVGHVAIDRTTLKHLLLHLRRNGEVISDLEIPNLKPVEVPRDDNGEPVAKRAKRSEAAGVEKQTRNRRQGEDDAEQTRIFWSHFPAAKRFLKGRKGAKLHPFLRTDGISCSVPLILPGRSAAKDEQGHMPGHMPRRPSKSFGMSVISWRAILSRGSPSQDSGSLP